MSKPSFDPNKAFEVAGQGAKPAFNPSSSFEVAEVAPQGSATEALIQGFGQQATLGYLPQIQAAVEPAIQGVMGLFGDNTDEQLRAQGFDIQQPQQDYTQRRDQYIREGQALAEASPIASGVGQLAGGLATGIATGGLFGGARAAGLAGRLGQAAKAGAVQGAIRNPGDTEGEISPLQLGERAKNVAFDAATGAVFQGGLEGAGKIGKILKDAPQSLQKYADNKTIKAVGAMTKDFNNVFKRGRVKELGKFIREEGLVSLGDDVAAIAEKSTALKNDIGTKVANIYTEADNLVGVTQRPVGVDFDAIKAEIMPGVVRKYKGMEGGPKIIKEIEDSLDYIASENGTTGFKKAWEIRQSIDDVIPYGSSRAEQSIAKEKTAFRNKINQKIKEGLGEIDQEAGTNLSGNFTSQNRRYSNIVDIEKMATKKAASAEANASMGLRERLSGQSGTIVGGAVGAAIGGVPGTVIGGAVGNQLNSITTKVAREYGTPFVAMTAAKIAKKLQENPESLGRFSDQLVKAASLSPADFVRTVNTVIKDPEYKKMENNQFSRSK